jgi:hypothetical protein
VARREAVRKHLKRGKLRGKKINGRWYIDLPDTADGRQRIPALDALETSQNEQPTTHTMQMYRVPEPVPREARARWRSSSGMAVEILGFPKEQTYHKAGKEVRSRPNGSTALL